MGEASNMSADDKKMMIQIGDLKSENEKLSIEKEESMKKTEASIKKVREEFEHKLHKQREELLEASNMSADDKKMMIQMGDLKSENEKLSIEKEEALEKVEQSVKKVREEFEYKLHNQREELIEASNMSAD